MANLSTNKVLNRINVELQEENNHLSGYSRDIVLSLDVEKHKKSLHTLGLIRSSGDTPFQLIDELIWILGSDRLRLIEDYPDLKEKKLVGLELVDLLQKKLFELKNHLCTQEKKTFHNLSSDTRSQTILKYHLIDEIRAIIADNDKFECDPINVSNAIDQSLKACLNYIDDFEFDKAQTNPELPDKLSLKALYHQGSIRHLNNDTPKTITWLLNKTLNEKSDSGSDNLKPGPTWFQQKPDWSPITNKGLINVFLTTLLTCLLVMFFQYIDIINALASTLSIANPIMASILAATIIMLGLSYMMQLTPNDPLTIKEFLLKTFRSFLTMMSCILVLIHFFYPYNVINLWLFKLLGLSLALTSSISIIATVLIFSLINQLLTSWTEPEKNHQFPPKYANDFLLYRPPYRNQVWQFFQKKTNIHILVISLMIIAAAVILSLYQQAFVLHVISSIATVFSVSSIIAILAIISLVFFIHNIHKITGNDIVEPIKKQAIEEHASWLDQLGMIIGFGTVMIYVLSIDFSIIRNIFSIIGNILSLKVGTIFFSSEILLVIVMLIVPFILPDSMDLKKMFSKNPFLQAEHIFMELNEFYYLYGLRHPIVMMIFLGLFIVSFASFYNTIIPQVIASFAYKLAIALISSNVGTGLLAFTSALMIGNILIISYDSLTSGKRSLIARLSKFWEMYPLDILAGTIAILVILNLFILVPYIQMHLGTVAMIGSLSFLFKISMIAYDFYRDNAQKSFLASLLLMLLWPFLAVKTLIKNPSYECFYDLARSLEKAIIFFLLTILYDFPFKIFLRISEVMVYGAFSILISFSKHFGIEKLSYILINSKKQFFKYLDYFRFSAQTTIFTNQIHYRLWHVLGVILLIWLSIHCIGLGISLIQLPSLTATGSWFSLANFTQAIFQNHLLHSIILIQSGWALALGLILALIRLTNFTHDDITFDEFKKNLFERCFELIVFTISFSAIVILLSFINLTIIPVIQMLLLGVGLIILTHLCFNDFQNGAHKMMCHCFNHGEFMAQTEHPLKATSPNKKVTEPTRSQPLWEENYDSQGHGLN